MVQIQPNEIYVHISGSEASFRVSLEKEVTSDKPIVKQMYDIFFSK